MSRQMTHPRDQIMRTMERIYRYRMTTTSGGNLSIREPAGDIWITPARVDKGSLTRDDIVRVTADGVTEGPHRPSSEFPFHQAVYEARPDIGAVVHAHPVALVAFSICRQTPDNAALSSGTLHVRSDGVRPLCAARQPPVGQPHRGGFPAGCDSVILEKPRRRGGWRVPLACLSAFRGL